VNPSANPASCFDFDQSKCTKKSEKNTELSLKDLGDQEFEINNIHQSEKQQKNDHQTNN